MSDSPLPRVLLVDDDAEFAGDLTTILSPSYRVETAFSAESGLTMLESLNPDVVLLDVDFGGGMNGYEFLENLPADLTAPAVVMLTGDREVESVIRAVKLGAFHYLCKPPDVDELINMIEKCLERRLGKLIIQAQNRELQRLSGSDEFVAGDRSTLAMLDQIDRFATTDATVLITGECGTGKEMIARRIHAASDRREGPFLGQNCGAVPTGLIESEFFGHERGSFTDAHSRHLGLFELAAGGTLFLDEIGDSPDVMQVKLLRVLEERCFFRVGGESSLEADVRIVAATSRDLEDDIRQGRFRQELFYRLNVVRIHLPPLRERKGDILPLAENFLCKSASRYRREIVSISPSARKALVAHDWPGNVRELSNAIERAVIGCSGDTLLISHLALGEDPMGQNPLQVYEEAKREAMDSFKRNYVISRLREAGGNITEAAARSGMLRQAFQRMVRELGIDPADFRSEN